MVVTDVDEVVGTETEGSDGTAVATVIPESRFDRLKLSYKGVASSLDLSEEASAYEDFASLLGDHKVGVPSCCQCVSCFQMTGVLITRVHKRMRVSIAEWLF